jgi:uncharacterized membrane protein YkvA (DUF1232 family)
MEVQPSIRIDPRLKDAVLSAVEHALTTISDEEFFYVGQRLDAKLEILGQSSTHWVQELCILARAFAILLRNHSDGTKPLDDSSVRIVGVALHYLVNPFDIIPDHVAGEGYADDALVLSHCAKLLKRHSPHRFSWALTQAKRHSKLRN